MSIKWVGALLIIAGCGGFGFSLAVHAKNEAKLLQSLLSVISHMECELQYKLTPLPELCRQAAKETRGALQEIFLNLTREMDWQIAPDAGSCMAEALQKSSSVPQSVRSLLMRLGASLGRYDLSGQLKELEAIHTACEQKLKVLTDNQESRQRSYRTLGLCAGAAAAILLV